MEKFVEKFNIFDIFTMLTPGVIILSLFGISLSFEYYDIWEKYGNEKYVLFFVAAYFCGIIFQEIGTLFDKLFLDKILFGGDPKEIYLLDNIDNKFHKVFRDRITYNNVIKIVESLKKYVDTSEITDQKKYNFLLFKYCLTICELKGISWKADKMLVISEMSRSLFWGCFLDVILNITMIVTCSHESIFLYLEIPLLLIASAIFIIRKKRYARYRIEIILKAYAINTIENNQYTRKENKIIRVN